MHTQGGSFNIFNTVGPTLGEPLRSKALPFPLETVGEDLGDIYFDLDKVYQRLKVALEANQAVRTPARVKRIKQAQYKVKTAMSAVRGVVRDLDDLGL